MQLQSSLLSLAVLIVSVAALPQGTNPQPTCTTTLTTAPHFHIGPTSTTYVSTATMTNSVDCGGCALSVTQAAMGPGPVVKYTTTVTAPITTVTADVCKTELKKRWGDCPEWYRICE